MVKAIPQSPGFFTADQANGMLPLVRRIVADWVELNATVESQQAQLEGLKTLHQTVGVRAYSEEVAEVEQSLQAERDRLVECYNELESLGLEPHAEEIGSVDFPAILHGREVRLCWRVGEPDVRHWHEIGGSISERQLITLSTQRMGG